MVDRVVCLAVLCVSDGGETERNFRPYETNGQDSKALLLLYKEPAASIDQAPYLRPPVPRVPMFIRPVQSFALI